MGLRLYVVSADGGILERDVEGEGLVVGRSSRAGLPLVDRALSREHARFSQKDGRWIIEDLGSHNGTLLNRVPLSGPQPLRDGDTVTLGGSVVRVELRGEREPAVSGSVTYRPAEDVLQTASGTVRAPELSAAGRRALDRLHLVNEVSRALATPISLEELLELILDRVFHLLRPQEAAIVLRDSSGVDHCVARRSAPGREARPMQSKSLLHEVIDKGMVAHVVDSDVDERFARSESLHETGLRSFVAAPLLDPQGALGMIVVGAALGFRTFAEEDIELLVSLASVAALRIRNVRLVAEAMERQRLEQEVRLARQIQVALLPAALPSIPGYELHGATLPSRGVSGDFYEVVPRPGGSQSALFVADVSGKGIAASLLTASLEALLALPLETDEPPDRICDQVSGLLFRRTPPEKFATAFLGCLEHESGRLCFVNAGHNPPLVLRADGRTEWLRASGLPLGLLRGARYRTGETALGPGDTLLVYTDGITEAMNPDSEEFGETRLVEVLQRHRDLALPEVAAAMDRELEAFARGVPFNDDRTLVLVRRSG